jgi:fibronectin-binding autotransporter adhesin
MKISPSLRRFFGPALFALLAPATLHAAAITWNNSGTDFNTAGSWSAGVPGSSDAATFNVAKVNDPNISANVSVGQLIFTSSGSGYNITSSNNSTLTLISTGTGTGTTGAGIAVRADAAVTNVISAPVVLGGAASSSHTFRGVANASTEFAGGISETNAGVGIILTNNGRWIFSGASSYTGETALTSGGIVINIRHNDAVGTTGGGVNMTTGGGAVELEGGVSIGAKALTLRNDGISSGGSLRNISGNNSWGGAITLLGSGVRINSDADTLTLNSGTAISGTQNLTLGGAGNITLHDGFQPGGNQTLTKDGSGTVTLLGASTYGGSTSVDVGVLNIRHATALGSTNNGTSVNSGAALELQGGIAVAGEALSLAGTGIGNGGALRNISGNNSWDGTITLQNSPTSHRINSDSGTLTIAGGITETGLSVKTLAFGGSGNITVDGVITATPLTAISITKDGAGTLTLSGQNTYNSATTVTEGTLLANSGTGSSTGAGSITVGANGTLGGIGRVAPTGANGISVSGIIAPGNSIGTLTFDMGATTGVVTMNANSGFEFELGSGGLNINSPGSSDLLAIAGAAANDFTFNNNTIDFLNTGAYGFYKLFDTDLATNPADTWSGLTVDINGVITGGLSFVNLGSGQFTGTLIMGGNSFGGDAGDIYLQVIPEPAAALLGGIGMLLILRRRRQA